MNCTCHLEPDPTFLCDACEDALTQAQIDARDEYWAELNWSTQ